MNKETLKNSSIEIYIEHTHRGFYKKYVTVTYGLVTPGIRENELLTNHSDSVNSEDPETLAACC
jgi:hypothetical protein